MQKFKNKESLLMNANIGQVLLNLDRELDQSHRRNLSNPNMNFLPTLNRQSILTLNSGSDNINLDMKSITNDVT